MSTATDLGPGPHLFLDDELIAHREGLQRVVHPPEKLDGPALSSTAFGTTQPYLSVAADPEQGGYRMWYNHGPPVWHARSDDGVHWRDPRVAWDIPRGYCCSVVDDGEREPDGARRFKMATWQSSPGRDDGPEDDGGLWVGFSADGLRWTGHTGNPVLRTWPEGYGKQSRYGVGDTCDVFYDSLRHRYACAIKVQGLKGEYPQGPRAGQFSRRLVGYTTSTDFVHWERPERILVPDEHDDGLLEFYGMGSLHQRGPLTVGLARILHDELPCDPGGPADGIGYSVLVISRDGKRWTRFRAPFLDRSPAPDAWDHAMAWASAVLPLGDELLIYYGGYARGHKVEPAKERQIGIARMKRDRYTSLSPTSGEGVLTTVPLTLPAAKLALNADARAGEIRICPRDPEGQAIRGFGETIVSGDGLALAPRWKRPLAELKGRPVRLEFRLRNASLYGFQVDPEARSG